MLPLAETGLNRMDLTHMNGVHVYGRNNTLIKCNTRNEILLFVAGSYRPVYHIYLFT